MTIETIDDSHVDELLPAFLNGSLDASEMARVRQHLESCLACSRELAAWQAISAAAQLDAARAPSPRPDLVRTAVARSAGRVDEAESPWSSLREKGRRFFAPLVGAAAAAALLVSALTLTPVGSYAQGFITIFTPKQFAAVPISQADISALAALHDYGTMSPIEKTKPLQFNNVAAASAAAGMPVVAPASLPSGVPNTPSYVVVPGQSGSFTFSAEKARATAAAKGTSPPPMPPNIDGSSLQVTTGAAVLAIYPSTSPRSGAQGQETAPALAVGQTRAPVIQATGVSVPDLEQYLLAQPGISPDLAQAIRALGDPTTTLPVPIPLNKAISHPVQVQGVSGLAIADSTGIGGGIVWEKNGMIYGVGGTFSEDVLLSVANSLR